LGSKIILEVAAEKVNWKVILVLAVLLDPEDWKHVADYLDA
jgi:hypothetical protein